MTNNATKKPYSVGRQFIAAGALLLASAAPGFAGDDALLVEKLLGLPPLGKQERQQWENLKPSEERLEIINEAKKRLAALSDKDRKGNCGVIVVSTLEPEKRAMMAEPILSQEAANLTALIASTPHPNAVFNLGCNATAEAIFSDTKTAVRLLTELKNAKAKTASLQQAAQGRLVKPVSLAQQATPSEAPRQQPVTESAKLGSVCGEPYGTYYPGKSKADVYLSFCKTPTIPVSQLRRTPGSPGNFQR